MPRHDQSTSTGQSLQVSIPENTTISSGSSVTAPQLLVRRSGIFLEISQPGVGRLPAHLENALTSVLVYDHTRHLRGLERLMQDGSQRYVEVTRRRLYDLTDSGALYTALGFFPRLAQIMKRLGYTYSIQDLSPERIRPEAYVPVWDRLNRFTEWRYRQQECVHTITQSMGGIINAIPAFGKTELIGRLACLYPRAKFAIVTRRTDVAQSIYRRLIGVIPGVGFVGNGKKSYGRVTVYVSKSMHKADPDVDFLFVDESHELASDYDSEILLRTFTDSRNFGFSATPDGRADGTSVRLEYMFGPTIFKLTWQEGVEHGLVVPVEVRWINISMDNDPAAGYSTEVSIKRHGLWRNGVRNSRIAEIARWHTDDQVLILVETVEQAIYLKQYLPEYTLCYGQMSADDLEGYIAVGLLEQNYVPVSPVDREEYRRKFETGELRKVIATDVWSTGVSFEQLAVLIRADSRASEIMDDQAPGRVVRTHAASGKSLGVVYDCWDEFNNKLLGKSRKKYSRYKDKGWAQIKNWRFSS